MIQCQYLVVPNRHHIMRWARCVTTCRGRDTWAYVFVSSEHVNNQTYKLFRLSLSVPFRRLLRNKRFIEFHNKGRALHSFWAYLGLNIEPQSSHRTGRDLPLVPPHHLFSRAGQILSHRFLEWRHRVPSRFVVSLKDGTGYRPIASREVTGRDGTRTKLNYKIRSIPSRPVTS